jgi:uncharacterized protein YciI
MLPKSIIQLFIKLTFKYTAMKNKMALILGLIFSNLLCAQDAAINNSVNGIPLKDYFFVMLTDGPNNNQDSVTEAKLMSGHVSNLFWLKKMGKLILSGPFTDHGKWFGLFFFDCRTPGEVEDYLKKDPAIAAGRLNYEIHPWRTLKNCLFK